ncbi:calcium calmodulin dependent protein kinase [Cryptosporidium ubiquitum]|uniref:non-specific serine/threonine protein kinase n=1 Tax=Cryptosporidium ubiquitum TaxID=857276 RepID=A0A1J4MAP5_9CRYT|nr:calcium calmodulin dependent protein kinase [Cryptosporidium ubiquitum]OII71297.1 calcium calmodulin dependent protein kinase [Cryptosporidium ubiquitum]
MGCTPSKGKVEFISRKREENTKEENKPVAIKNDLHATPGMFITSKKGHLSEMYQRVKKLGSGAYGEVLLCRDKVTHVERAIKIIRKTSVSTSSNSTLLEEVAVLKLLDHPNIMKLYDFFEDKRNYYIVMECYKGGELFDEIIHRMKFNEVDAAVIIRQVLSGVTYLHKHNIVHRDLKPENLLLESKDKDAMIKIVDFGLSAVFENQKKMKERLGTAYYIAPEVLRKKYDEKCDVWSIGVILFILLAGYPPFGGQTDQEILKKVEKGKYTFDSPEWKSVSEGAKDLIKQMLQYDSQRRISAQQALEHPWIKEMCSKKESGIELPSLANAIENMRRFQNSQKLAQAALLYMASKLTSQEETKELTDIFRHIDKNGDGQLDRQELIDGYSKLSGEEVAIFNLPHIENEVDAIIGAADFDRNGYIDYSEFVTIAMDRKSLLSKDKLESAFQKFDQDGNGKISIDELASIFGLERLESKTWKEMISGIDSNNDGDVDFEEFCKMIQKLCSNNEPQFEKIG